jgi:hypothetical protein
VVPVVPARRRPFSSGQDIGTTVIIAVPLDTGTGTGGGETVSGLHAALGFLTLVTAVGAAMTAGLAWAGFERRWGVGAARTAEVIALILGLLVLAALFIGGLLLITGLRPMTSAHILLAVAALAAVPIAAGTGLWREHGAGRSRARSGWLAGGALVTALLGLLLAATG